MKRLLDRRHRRQDEREQYDVFLDPLRPRTEQRAPGALSQRLAEGRARGRDVFVAASATFVVVVGLLAVREAAPGIASPLVSALMVAASLAIIAGVAQLMIGRNRAGQITIVCAISVLAVSVADLIDDPPVKVVRFTTTVVSPPAPAPSPPPDATDELMALVKTGKDVARDCRRLPADDATRLWAATECTTVELPATATAAFYRFPSVAAAWDFYISERPVTPTDESSLYCLGSDVGSWSADATKTVAIRTDERIVAVSNRTYANASDDRLLWDLATCRDPASSDV